MCEPEEVVVVKELLASSKSKFFRNLPKFIVRKIERIIRQDELNIIYKKYCHLFGMDFVKANLFEEFKIKLNIVGEEKIPKDGSHIYVANHPVGGVDALTFLYLVEKNQGNVISPSNEIFEYVPNFRPVIVPVNVFGTNTKAKVRAVNDAFESEKQIMMFPAGEVSRKINGEIKDPIWQKTFVTKAVQFKRDIIPVFISGQNSKKFYRIAKLRKLLGIKMYIETLLLPQELLKQYNSKVDMIIGEPIKYEEIENSKLSHYQWTKKIRDMVYEQGNDYTKSGKL